MDPCRSSNRLTLEAIFSSVWFCYEVVASKSAIARHMSLVRTCEFTDVPGNFIGTKFCSSATGERGDLQSTDEGSEVLPRCSTQSTSVYFPFGNPARLPDNEADALRRK